MSLSTLGIFTPETETTCHLWTGLYRDFAIDNQQLSEMINKELRITIDEDTAICGEVQANWKEGADVVHLAVDQASIAARQILDKLLALESAVQQPAVLEVS